MKEMAGLSEFIIHRDQFSSHEFATDSCEEPSLIKIKLALPPPKVVVVIRATRVLSVECKSHSREH